MLRVTFGNGTVTGRVSGTAGLLPDSLFGTVENGVCRLGNADSTSVWEGHCDARGFSGTFTGRAARGMVIDGRFETSARSASGGLALPPRPAGVATRERYPAGPVRMPYDSAALPDLPLEVRNRVAALYGVSAASFDAKRPVWSGYSTLEVYADGRRRYQWLLYYLCMKTEPGCLTDASYAHTHIAIYDPDRNKLYVGSRRDSVSLWCRELPSRVCSRSTASGRWQRTGPDIDYNWTLAALSIANRRADSHTLLARCLTVNGQHRSWVAETRDGYGGLVDIHLETREAVELRNTCNEPIFVDMEGCPTFLWYAGPFAIYPGWSESAPMIAASCRMFALIALPPF